MPERPYEIVLFGATGFTGGLVADHLAAAPELSGPPRWAIAGRDRTKLAAVRDRLAAANPALAELELLEADATDARALAEIARSAQVVASTVGPYINFGQELVAACARAGTDYVDLCGEPEFVDLMWLRHHTEAERTGARLIHACGFDSVPHDLGTLFTVSQLPEGVPLSVQEYLRSDGTFSGGTYHSLVHGLSRARGTLRVAGRRRREEARPAGRATHRLTGPPRREELAGGWIVLAPTIDADIVLRSARALDRYGPDFSFGFYVVTKRASTIGAMAAGLVTLGTLAQIPPARDLLLKLKQPGDGPDEARRARSWFTARFVGRVGGAAEPSVVCEVRGGDPGYGETAKMLAESALCLTHDELPALAGQLTPAVAMGEALISRLRGAGISFEVISTR